VENALRYPDDIQSPKTSTNPIPKSYIKDGSKYAKSYFS